MLTPEQSWQRFDEEARHTLGMSGEEFARRFEAGEYGDPDHSPKLMSVAFA